MAASKGVGCDCLGLILGVYKDITGITVPFPMRYSPNWTRTAQHGHALLDALHHLGTPAKHPLQAGDILIFALTDGRIIHAGIMVEEGNFIHALADPAIAKVTLSPFTDPWARRLHARYTLPTIP
jgi:NlpC/P60 family putative phage cell wall peptidase